MPSNFIICHLVYDTVLDFGHAYHVMELLFISRFQVYVLFTLSSFQALKYL